MKDSLSQEDLLKAQEFARAYSEHIKEQVKFLAVERAKTGEEYKGVRVRHAVSNKYNQFKQSANTSSFNISNKS